MIQRLGKKKNSRSTTVCACGRHFIAQGVEVYGIKVKGSVLYRQIDCHNFPLLGDEDLWHKSLVNEGSLEDANRFFNSYIKVIFSDNEADRQVQLDYFAKQKGWTVFSNGAVIELTTAYSFSHIYKVIYDEPDLAILIRNENTEGEDILIHSFEEYKAFTDKGFDFD